MLFEVGPRRAGRCCADADADAARLFAPASPPSPLHPPDANADADVSSVVGGRGNRAAASTWVTHTLCVSSRKGFSAGVWVLMVSV
eukprot:3021517-Rhodomonas_salina.2